MKAIFPATIDGDLLKLVHLSNGFRLIEGPAPLKAGDVCKAEARIVSVINTDAGKAVSTGRCHCCRSCPSSHLYANCSPGDSGQK